VTRRPAATEPDDVATHCDDYIPLLDLTNNARLSGIPTTISMLMGRTARLENFQIFIRGISELSASASMEHTAATNNTAVT
jgi:hypothetical protein